MTSNTEGTEIVEWEGGLGGRPGKIKGKVGPRGSQQGVFMLVGGTLLKT